MRHNKQINITFFIAFLTILLAGCADKTSSVKEEKTPASPDYNKKSSWVCQSDIDKPIDVFYVYPTIYNGKSPANMDISDTSLRSKAKNLITSQAGVFAQSANIFAPFYCQMSMAKLNPEEDMYQNKYYEIGYNDVKMAFNYYMENINNGRPFILAGHSQGSMTLISLMRDLFNSPDLQKQLVAAYLIGYSITPEDFKNYPWMKPATNSGDTGVIISYNTQAPGATNSPVLLPGAFCINPLNWTTNSTYADKSLNYGAVFFDGTNINREIINYSGAQIDKQTGALTTILTEELDVGVFPDGIYHKYDYSIWYRNLQTNVAERCKNYLNR